MSASNRAKGNCEFCGRKMTSGGLVKHLKSCDDRNKAIIYANESSGKTQEQRLYHLYIKNFYNSNFWLHLELNGNVKLKVLDDYLRAIWLECCEHMSHFTLGNNAWGDEISMNRKVYQLLETDMELTHVYDFGSSTITSIKTVDTRWGKPLTGHPIFLMARNEMPEVHCERCNKKATWLLEDYDSFDGGEFLCEKHKEEEVDDEYDERLLELVNSPRFGVCGYTGPATDPYKVELPFGDYWKKII